MVSLRGNGVFARIKNGRNRANPVRKTPVVSISCPLHLVPSVIHGVPGRRRRGQQHDMVVPRVRCRAPCLRLECFAGTGAPEHATVAWPQRRCRSSATSWGACALLGSCMAGGAKTATAGMEGDLLRSPLILHASECLIAELKALEMEVAVV